MKWKNRTRWLTTRIAAPLMAFVLAAGFAVAAPGEDTAGEPIDLGKSCSLTVSPGSGSAELTEDLAKADVVIDLYEVARAVEVPGYDTYTYEAADGYGALKLNDVTSNAGWDALAQQAARIAIGGEEKKSPVKSAEAVNTQIDGLDSGLYLLIARSRTKDYVKEIDVDDTKEIVTVAYSGRYAYTYQPSLVSLPGKAAVTENGPLNTANPGPWIYSQSVTLKPEQSLNLGSLLITKNLPTYKAGADATFVFDVTATLEGETVYSEAVSVSFTEPGTKEILIENKIPVGAEVTVTEVYSGAVYSVPVGASVTVPMENAEVPAEVMFTNNYNASGNNGGTIVNHFEHTDGSWTHTPIKAQNE